MPAEIPETRRALPIRCGRAARFSLHAANETLRFPQQLPQTQVAPRRPTSMWQQAPGESLPALPGWSGDRSGHARSRKPQQSRSSSGAMALERPDAWAPTIPVVAHNELTRRSSRVRCSHPGWPTPLAPGGTASRPLSPRRRRLRTPGVTHAGGRCVALRLRPPCAVAGLPRDGPRSHFLKTGAWDPTALRNPAGSLSATLPPTRTTPPSRALPPPRVSRRRVLSPPAQV